MISETKRKVSDRMKALIQDMIFKEMKPGDRLPTEAMLSEQFGASRSSIREALQALEAARIVEKRNNGTFVASRLEECFADPLSTMVQLSMVELSELLELRQILESQAAGYAALRASDSQIRELENLVWLMQKPSITIQEYMDLDVQFHLAVSGASGNTALNQLIRDVYTVLIRHFPKSFTLEFAQASTIPCLNALIQAIREGNQQEAGICMSRHLSESLQRIQCNREPDHP